MLLQTWESINVTVLGAEQICCRPKCHFRPSKVANFVQNLDVWLDFTQACSRLFYS